MHPNVRTTNRQNGCQLIATTDTVTGEFVAIDVLADTTKFHTLTGNQTAIANATEGSATAIPKGTTIDGLFTAIKLHAGTVIAYRK
jgi:hypothetical protein